MLPLDNHTKIEKCLLLFTANTRQTTTVCRLPFAVCRLPFAVCRLPFAVNVKLNLSNKLTSLPTCGFIAQLVEHRTDIRGGHGFTLASKVIPGSQYSNVSHY